MTSLVTRSTITATNKAGASIAVAPEASDEGAEGSSGEGGDGKAVEVTEVPAADSEGDDAKKTAWG